MNFKVKMQSLISHLARHGVPHDFFAAVVHDVVPRGLEPRLGSSSRLSAAAATAVRQILDGVSYLERILSPALDRDAPIGWDFNG